MTVSLWLTEPYRTEGRVNQNAKVEHIAGEDADTQAVRMMCDALAPGGRLILTTSANAGKEQLLE